MSHRRLIGLAAPMAFSIWLAAGCTRPAPPPVTSPASATKPGAFPRQQLVEDARELADIIESTHPDPYSGGGGRIAFHRRLHQALNAIPDEGMTKDEFYRLLRPFVAGVGDAHTNLVRGYVVDHDRPGGVPLRLRVVEESLVVVGVERSNEALLGSRLVSVEGVALAELVERQRRLRGIDNQYHALYELATRSLAYRAYLQDLIPEWNDTARVRVELMRPDGSVAAVELKQPGSQPDEVRPRSRVVLPPVSGETGFRTAFLRPPDGGEELAYVRFAHMSGYREAREQRDPILTKLERPPSATAEFRDLVVEMKRRGTQTLILDVRGNPGGNSLISEILAYYLYGREQLLKMAGVGTGEHGAFR